jgi:hypothetical protein
MNGKSTFQAVEGSEYHCLFRGQAKRKDMDFEYVTPLLCRFEDFNKTLIILREKQPPNIASYTNKEVSKMYQKQVRRPLDRFGFPFMPKCKIHDFRAAYCSFVYCMFDCPNTFASTTCDVVGHESIHESLSYNHIKLQGVGGAENSLGPLKPEAEGDNVEKQAAMLLLEFGKA